MQALRRHLEEGLKVSDASGKTGTFKIVEKNKEGRFYLVEAPWYALDRAIYGRIKAENRPFMHGERFS